MIPACIFPHQHQQFWSSPAVDNILLKYFINLRSLRIFSNHQHRNYLPYSISKLSTSGFLALIWLRLCWRTANEMFFKITNTRISCRFSNSSTIIQDFWPCSGVVIIFSKLLLSGFLALLWCGLWWWIVEDSPDQDRSITDAELEYLQVGDRIFHYLQDYFEK